jgi:aminocarboxymuconate-semialdehyde decarboxylase
MSHSVIDAPELGDAINRYGPSAGRNKPASAARLDTITVDIHAHVVIPEAAKYMEPHFDPMRIAMVKHANDHTREVNVQQDKDRMPVAMSDVKDRIAVLDTQGINMQVVAPPPPQCYYQSPIEHALKGSQMVNDGIAEWIAPHPDRFAGLGTVPLQDPVAAVKELDRCINSLHLKGVMILTNVDGEEVAAERFEPFWRKAEELGALVMIHPNGFTEGDRLHEYYFSNVFGNPLETSLALHYLIFNGVMERMPDLKILGVHGGGYLPAYSGRIDHAWGARSDCQAGLPKEPTHYLRKMYFDSVVFSHHQLEYLVNVFGEDHIVMGSDYPFDMADYDPVEHIATSALTKSAKAKVAGENAIKLLNL